MPLLARRGCLAARVEGVAGTDAVPTVLDAGIVVDSIRTPGVKAEIIPRDHINPTFSQPDHNVGNQMVEIAFNAELKGHPTLGQPPDITALLRACGLVETFPGANTTQYAFVTPYATQKTATIAIYFDGKLFKAVGCMGNARLVLKENGKARWEFAFKGVYAPTTDAAILAPAYYSMRPVDPRGAGAFTYRSIAMVATGFEFDLGNDVQLREDITKASGHIAAIIAKREPKIMLDPEEVLAATFDWEAAQIAGTPGAFYFQIGTVGGNRHTFTFPHVQIEDAPLADRTGKVTRNVVLGVRRSSMGVLGGDDDFTYLID